MSAELYKPRPSDDPRDDRCLRLGLPEPGSTIDPENTRSRRIAVKIGMTVGGAVFDPVPGLPIDARRLRR